MRLDTSQARALVTLAFVISLMAAMLLLVGFYDYRVDNGKQAACEDAFGPSAEWVGLTNDFNGVICETPDGDLHAHDTLGEPQGTFVGFLQSIGGSA